jgi:hypothetical protein
MQYTIEQLFGTKEKVGLGIQKDRSRGTYYLHPDFTLDDLADFIYQRYYEVQVLVYEDVPDPRWCNVYMTDYEGIPECTIFTEEAHWVSTHTGEIGQKYTSIGTLEKGIKATLKKEGLVLKEIVISYKDEDVYSRTF